MTWSQTQCRAVAHKQGASIATGGGLESAGKLLGTLAGQTSNVTVPMADCVHSRSLVGVGGCYWSATVGAWSLLFGRGGKKWVSCCTILQFFWTMSITVSYITGTWLIFGLICAIFTSKYMTPTKVNITEFWWWWLLCFFKGENPVHPLSHMNT